MCRIAFRGKFFKINIHTRSIDNACKAICLRFEQEFFKMKAKLPKKVIKDEPLRKASEEDRARLARTRAKPDNDELLRDEADSACKEQCKDCIHYVACKKLHREHLVDFHEMSCGLFEDRKTYLKIPESLIQREGYPVNRGLEGLFQYGYGYQRSAITQRRCGIY